MPGQVWANPLYCRGDRLSGLLAFVKTVCDVYREFAPEKCGSRKLVETLYNKKLIRLVLNSRLIGQNWFAMGHPILDVQWRH